MLAGALPAQFAPIPNILAGNTPTITRALRLSSPDGPPDACLVRFASRATLSVTRFFVQTKGWKINNFGFRDGMIERPVLGDLEVWEFYNPSNVAHPMHIHGTFFQVSNMATAALHHVDSLWAGHTATGVQRTEWTGG